MTFWIVNGLLAVFSAALIGKVLMAKYPNSGFNLFGGKTAKPENGAD